MRHDPTHVGVLASLRYERLDRRGRVPAVPLRLDDGVADLHRPLLVDERAADLADHQLVLGAVKEEGTELPLGPDRLSHASG